MVARSRDMFGGTFPFSFLITTSPRALDSAAKIYEIVRDVFSFGASQAPSDYSDLIYRSNALRFLRFLTSLKHTRHVLAERCDVDE